MRRTTGARHLGQACCFAGLSERGSTGRLTSSLSKAKEPSSTRPRFRTAPPASWSGTRLKASLVRSDRPRDGCHSRPTYSGTTTSHASTRPRLAIVRGFGGTRRTRLRRPRRRSLSTRVVLTNGPRQACNPPNAILNYLDALLEAETTIACQRVGLDSGLGVFHTDRSGRASLALDAMEAVRPAVDAYVLVLLTQRTLSRKDFVETRQGLCRLNTRLATELAETLASWQAQIAPVIESVMHQLAVSSPRMTDLTTPLTRTNHRVAWDARAPERQRRQTRTGTLALPATCRDCGGELPSRRHRYCEDCRRLRWEQHASRGRKSAGQVLASLRAEQRDPGHGGRAAELRGTKNAAHQAAVKAWVGGRSDPSIFTAEILPGLRAAPIAALVAATGLSGHYCSLIRLGKRVPHPRHWAALRHVVNVSC